MGWAAAIASVAAALNALAAAFAGWRQERRRHRDAGLAEGARSYDKLAKALRARLRHRDDAASGRLPDADRWRRD